MSATLAFPQPEPTDPDSVADALDAGLLHWVKGETTDALRCLRQARDASDEAGNEKRALALASIAADLTPRESDAPPASPSSTAEPQPSEPRRSRLPEPPSPPKKFTGAAEDTASAAAARQPGARSSVAPINARSTPPAAQHHTEQAKPPATTSGPVSARPSPPSTRPTASAATSVAPAAQTPTVTRSASSTQAAASGGKTTLTPTGASTRPEPAKTEPAKTEPAKTEPAKSRVDVGPPIAVRPTDSEGTAPVASSEARSKSHTPSVSNRPESVDHRLASVRVRVDRIEPDGSIRLRQLDLAATASGEDNAMLVLPQALWQELKRNG